MVTVACQPSFGFLALGILGIASVGPSHLVDVAFWVVFAFGLRVFRGLVRHTSIWVKKAVVIQFLEEKRVLGPFAFGSIRLLGAQRFSFGFRAVHFRLRYLLMASVRLFTCSFW